MPHCTMATRMAGTTRERNVRATTKKITHAVSSVMNSISSAKLFSTSYPMTEVPIR